MLRRTFIATGTLSLFAGPSLSQTFRDTHLVIVGCGAAGLAAACRASELGVKNILILEKEPLIGGSSMVCGGHWSVSNTQYQRDRNIIDDDKTFFTDLMNDGQWKNDPQLVCQFIRKGREEFEYLYSNGIRPVSLWASGGSGIPRGHVFNPQEIMIFLLNKALSSGVRILTSAKLIGLKQDKPDTVHQVVIERSGRKLIVNTSAVILASGGFANNREMLSQYLPELENVQIFSGTGNTGDAHKIAIELGAEMVDTEFIKPSYGFLNSASGAEEFTMIFYAGALILNAEGKRFIDESTSYKDIGFKALSQTNGKTFILFDERILRSQIRSRPSENLLWKNARASSKKVFVGDDLYELSRRAGMNPENVLRTVRNYNEAIDNGEDDEFGRKTLSGNFGNLVKLNEPPYYVMPAYSGIMGTYCGLRVNPKCQIIKKGKQPFVNLLAAGEIMGGVHGANFTAGCGFGKALAFGRLAGETASEILL